MRTKLVVWSLASLILATGGILAAARAADRIFGYLDPLTGIFTPATEQKPASASALADPPAAIVARTGRLVINATINIVSTIPTGTEITAGGTMSVVDASYSSGAGKQVAVTRSGNTGNVTISFNYLLAAASASTNMKVTLWVRTFAPGNPFAQLTQTIPLPANGATTTLTFPVSL